MVLTRSGKSSRRNRETPITDVQKELAISAHQETPTTSVIKPRKNSKVVKIVEIDLASSEEDCSISEKNDYIRELSDTTEIETEEIDEGNSSEDDSPIEITSKKQITASKEEESNENEKSIFETIQEKKIEETKKSNKKLPRRVKRKEISKGKFEVKTNNAAFTVVSLDKELDTTLDNVPNYRSELLAARTSNLRFKSGGQVLHRMKWINR